jgi:hypothetical protein
MAFFCEQCDADWNGVGRKQIHIPKGSVCDLLPGIPSSC